MEPQLAVSLVSVCDLLIYSNQLTLLSNSVSGTPTGVTATRTAHSSARVSWIAPSSGTPPAGYEVFYQKTGSINKLSGGNTSNTELTLTGLIMGVSYTIYVVSYGADGAPVLPSALSNMDSVMIGELKLFSNQ